MARGLLLREVRLVELLQRVLAVAPVLLVQQVLTYQQPRLRTLRGQLALRRLLRLAEDLLVRGHVDLVHTALRVAPLLALQNALALHDLLALGSVRLLFARGMHHPGG